MVIIRIEAKVFDDGALEQSLEPWGAKYLPWQISEPLGVYFPIQLFSYQCMDILFTEKAASRARLMGLGCKKDVCPQIMVNCIVCSFIICISFVSFFLKMSKSVRCSAGSDFMMDALRPWLEGQEDIINAPPAPSRPSRTVTDSESGPSHWQRTTWSVGSPKSGSDYKWQLLPLPTQGKPFESESVLRGGIFAVPQHHFQFLLTLMLFN